MGMQLRAKSHVFLLTLTMINMSFNGCIHTRKSCIRELELKEIGSMLRRFTGRSLPKSADSLRAIYVQDGGRERLFLSMHVREDDCGEVLEIFNGKSVDKVELLKDSYPPSLCGPTVFYKVLQYEQHLGISLFDKNLIKRITDEQHLKISKRVMPSNSLNGFFLQYGSLETSYEMLVLTDIGTIYIMASKGREL